MRKNGCFLFSAAVIACSSVLLLSAGEALRVHGEEGVVCPHCGSDEFTYHTGEYEVRPGCETEGKAWYDCSACQTPLASTRFSVTVPANGHRLIEKSEERVEPDCENAGAAYYICAVCQQEKKEILPARGHAYDTAVLKEATCTEGGLLSHTCSRCGDTYEEEKAATGHDYRMTVTRESSCTERELRTYTCSHCGDHYEEKGAPVSHDYQVLSHQDGDCETPELTVYQCSRCKDTYEEKGASVSHDYEETEHREATCTEGGRITKKCTRCKDTVTEETPAMGHDFVENGREEPGCETPGLYKQICTRCGETKEEEIPPVGHHYGGEDPETGWEILKEATLFTPGLREKKCDLCGAAVSEEIPKKSPIPALIIGGGALALLSGLLIALKKAGVFGGKTAKKAAEKILEETADNLEEAAEKELLEPEFEDKTVLTVLGAEAEKFFGILKAQSHIHVAEGDFENLAADIEENEPDLVLIDLTEHSLEELTKSLEETEEASAALLVPPEMMEIERETLEKLKNEKKIFNYGSTKANPYVNLVKLVLPALKPNLRSDEALDNIGMVADALGIPGISAIISVYVAGREIKETVAGAEGELSFVDKSTIISDLASILGLETVSSVAGLVGDVDDIKSSLENRKGANDVKVSKEGIQDIADVVSDILG